jgi:hypothetical protein
MAKWKQNNVALKQLGKKIGEQRHLFSNANGICTTRAAHVRSS